MRVSSRQPELLRRRAILSRIEKHREMLREAMEQLNKTPRCNKCGSLMAHYRLYGYKCPVGCPGSEQLRSSNPERNSLTESPEGLASGDEP